MRQGGKNRKHDTAKNRTTVIWLVVMAIFLGELFLYTWSRVQCTTTGYAIARETEKHRNLLALQQNLRVELASLKSPERIARIARQQLGLVSPNPEQTVTVP